jgi:arylsulfatase A-like enzyme
MKNIILLITDTYRYDNLGDRATAMPVRTPELDRFVAERAAEVHRFYTGSFPTIPHRTDVATGRLGWPTYGWQSIDKSGRNHVGKILGQAGYASQLVCDCPHLFKADFDQGFTAAFHHRGQEGDKPVLHLNDPIPVAMPPEKTRQRPNFQGHTLAATHRWTNRYPRLEEESFPAKTGATVCRWLEENYEAGPFFLWVDFFDPHEPWDPPEYLVRRYDPDYDGTPMIHPNYGRSGDYTEAELRNLRAHYCAEAELIDRWLGRVLQKIDDLGLWEDSVVVITSDHGMSLGEHGRTGKSNISDADSRYWPIYPEIGHVPFLVAAPDVPRADHGLLAQPMDILPTVCDLAGVSPEPPEPFDGRSFADALRNGDGSHRDLAVSGSHLRAQPGDIPAKASTPFVVDERWGYAPVGAAGQPELYDLAADPLAATDVADANPDVVATMHERFLAHLRANRAPAELVNAWGRNPRLGSDGAWAIDYPNPAI